MVIILLSVLGLQTPLLSMGSRLSGHVCEERLHVYSPEPEENAPS